jgi:hypothetical protein
MLKSCGMQRNVEGMEARILLTKTRHYIIIAKYMISCGVSVLCSEGGKENV